MAVRMTVTADLATLESVAQQLAARLRDDDPKLVHAWLAHQLPQPADWYRLCFVLACAVPDDRTWGELTAWAKEVPHGRPHPGKVRPANPSRPRTGTRRTAAA